MTGSSRPPEQPATGAGSAGEPLAEPDVADVAPVTPWSRATSTALTVGLLALLLGSAALIFSPVPSELKGLGVLGAMIALMALTVPIGIALVGCSFLGLWGISGWSGAVSSVGTLPYRAVASWSLAVLPMFILMGLLLWRAGVTARVYAAAQQWLHWLPGGLAVTTNFAGAGLAAVSGSTMGTTYALGRIGLPEMLKAGYDSRLATGAVLMAGTGGQLIPPSILMVIYAGIAEVPVGPQLMAGVGPGVVLALAYGVVIIGVAAGRPRLAPRPPAGTIDTSRRWRVTLAIWPIPLLIVAIVGGIFTGVFTATEAGAYGAFGAVLIAAGYLGWRSFTSVIRQALVETAVTTASILLLVVGAQLMSRVLSLSGLSRWLTEGVISLNLSATMFLLLLVVVYLFLGMMLDSLTMMLLTVPILLPILGELGISALWFGAFVVLLGELAIITPPVGVLSFVVSKVAQEPDIRALQHVRLNEVFAGALWFLPVAIAVLLLMILVPEVVEWLPMRTRG